MSIVTIIVLPFLGSVCAALLPANARNIEAWLAGAVTVACAVVVALHFPQIGDGGVVRESISWLPQLGIDFQLRMDGYAWMFALLVTGIGALVVLYARYYMSPADPVPRFFAFLLAFMGAMLGVVLSGNLIQLVVFWELTSLTSFMLIAYWYHRADARRGAFMALGVTATGGLCLLASVLLLGQVTGSYELDDVLAAGDQVRSHSWYPAILILLLLGVFTKSAQFPFHFWLPHAMAAPTPVSAYLHSATMVKAGVFLLARFWPVLAGTDLWFVLVCGAGLASLLVGAYLATFQRDLKGVLAYSTISHLGLITLLLGMNSSLALVAAVFHMMNHATFKASLFMAAGIVDHETGTRDLSRLGGLARAMPGTAMLALVSAAAMAGVPLLNGFLSKEMFFAETIFAGESLGLRAGLPLAATLAGIFSVAYSLRFVHQVFFGAPAVGLSREPHDPTWWMLAPIALLVITCVLVGVRPGDTIGPVLHAAMQSLLGPGLPAYSLTIWHGLTLPLIMSSIALVGGVMLYAWLRSRGRALAAAPLLHRLDGRRCFDAGLIAAVRTADRTVRLMSSRRLQPQLAVMLATLLLIAGLAMLRHPAFPDAGRISAVDPSFALLWLIGGACAIGAALQGKFHRLAALIMVGGAGLVTALTFAWFSAPDLALTQISVEVVTVVLILLGLRWLPKRVPEMEAHRQTLRAKTRRVRDLLLAIAAGTGMAWLSFVILTRPRGNGISTGLLERALPDGGGHNVVNVILVDFRGFDTLGEITVVGIVALTVYKVLRRFRPPPESAGPPTAQRGELELGDVDDPSESLPRGAMRIPAVLGRLLMPVAGVISIYFLLRGHDAPGGGFVGGLVIAIAFIVQYMVSGTLWVEARLRIYPQYWIAGGLLSATLAGVGAWLAGRSFLSSISMDLPLPVFGDLHLASTLLFDIGVYLLVVGATTLMLIALAHQSLRSHRRTVPDRVPTRVLHALPTEPGRPA